DIEVFGIILTLKNIYVREVHSELSLLIDLTGLPSRSSERPSNTTPGPPSPEDGLRRGSLRSALALRTKTARGGSCTRVLSKSTSRDYMLSQERVFFRAIAA